MHNLVILGPSHAVEGSMFGNSKNPIGFGSKCENSAFYLTDQLCVCYEIREYYLPLELCIAL